MSLKRRIKDLNVNELREDVVAKTKAILKHIHLEDMVTISAGGATFYSWVKHKILCLADRLAGVLPESIHHNILIAII